MRVSIHSACKLCKLTQQHKDDYGAHLAQHLILIIRHIIHLVGTGTNDPFQSVLIEFATDVHQHSGRAGINVTVQNDTVSIVRDMDAIAQDYANK